MAIYHMSIQAISRPRNAVGCAAYRSGTRLIDEKNNAVFDYRNKGKDGVCFSEIALCANAPERFLDRQTLWNEVQAVENKSDSRLSREFEMALPKELPLEVWVRIGRAYAANMTAQGMIADWSIHNPVNKETGLRENPHIHMMCTTRPIKANGEWGSKEKKVYKLDENGERIPVIDPETGEQKIGAKGRKMWQRETVEATGWDNRSKIYEWREKWAEVVNKQLDLYVEDTGIEPIEHIDHRSNEARGIEERPTKHEGYKAREVDKELMASKGIHGELVQKNIDTKEYNRLLPALKALGQKVLEKARSLYERVSEHAGIRRVYKPFGRKLPPVTEGELGTEGVKRAFERREREIELREREAASIIERIRGLRAEKKAERAFEQEFNAAVRDKDHVFSSGFAEWAAKKVVEYEQILESVKNHKPEPFERQTNKFAEIRRWEENTAIMRSVAARAAGQKKPLKKDLPIRSDWATNAQKRDEEILKMPLYTTKKVVTPAEWRASGSAGNHHDNLYSVLAQKIIDANQLTRLRKLPIFGNSAFKKYDSKYTGEVFIIKPSQLKKAEKLAEGLSYVAVPLENKGKQYIGFVCDDLHSDRIRDKLKSVLNFNLYIDYTPEKERGYQERRPYTSQEKVEQVKERERAEKESIRERLARAKEKVKEREESRAETLEPPEKSYDDDLSF